MIWVRAYDIMKKLLLFLLSVTLILSFTACGNKNTASGSESSSDKSNQSVSAEGKTLVVYFSATGSTRAVAEAIAAVSYTHLTLPTNREATLIGTMKTAV